MFTCVKALDKYLSCISSPFGDKEDLLKLGMGYTASVSVVVLLDGYPRK